MTDSLLLQFWVQRLGWTLLHFLWQGTVIAGVYAVLRKTLIGSLSAESRYTLACLALGTMTAAPLATYLMLPFLNGGAVLAWWDVSAREWQHVLLGVVAAWLAGVAAFSFRLAAGWRFTVRLRAVSHPAPAEWQQVLARTAARMGGSGAVRLMVSSLAEVPVVIGWLKPVILVPVGSLTGLSPEYLTALLAHELAHIRRHDYLAGLIQKVAECLLFYHPAVWWVSRQIRMERELCCDDLAVAASGDAATYALALAELESQRLPRFSTSLAANGGPLVQRIRRLLGASPTVVDSFPAAGTTWAMSLLWITGTGLAIAHAAQTAVASYPRNDLFGILRAVPEAIVYNPFLPSAEALRRKYGQPHVALPNGSDLLRPVPGSLESRLPDVLHVGAEGLRQNAAYAPLPQYPQPSLRSGNQGLVVIEVAVGPEGRAVQSLILASFDRKAAAAVTAALNTWRFYSLDQFPTIFGNWRRDCGACIRVGRLGFEFRIAGGKGQVVDLADAEIKRRRLPNPFLIAESERRP